MTKLEIDKMEMEKIKFKEKEYFLVGEIEGSICTLEEFEKGLPSFAYLFEDGIIKRNGKIIGNIDDIEIIEENVNIEFKCSPLEVIKNFFPDIVDIK